jgi:hypothetical protein
MLFMFAKALKLAAVASCFFLAAGNSFADDRSVSLIFSGLLPPKCVLVNPNSTVDLGLLNQRGTASVSFTLSCNADFHFSLVSESGGLIQQGEKAHPPFISLIPYSVSLNLGPNRISDPRNCVSGKMVDLRPVCSGKAGANITNPAAQNASLSFSWNLAGNVPLAGVYRDTLVLTVGPGF